MPNYSFENYAANKKPQIEAALIRIANTQPPSMSPPYKDLRNQLSALVGRGGKRLRPLLCMLAYEGYGGGRPEAILPAAVSQELLHAFLLIHDDIVDRDYKRWGGNNILGHYFEHFSATMSSPNALHAAESRALLAGDICLTLANDTLLASNFEPHYLWRAQKLQQQTLLQVLQGELADTEYATQVMLPSESQVVQMYRDKTSSYSFCLPLKLGALLADATEEELELIHSMAQSIGVAFQLQDDLLGIFGDETVTGKPVLGDLREGKRTVLMLKTITLANQRQRKEFLQLYGKSGVDEADLLRVQLIMRECGAQAYVTEIIAKYTDTALSQLAKTNLNQPARTRLADLIAALCDRNE